MPHKEGATLTLSSLLVLAGRGLTVCSTSHTPRLYGSGLTRQADRRYAGRAPYGPDVKLANTPALGAKAIGRLLKLSPAQSENFKDFMIQNKKTPVHGRKFLPRTGVFRTSRQGCLRSPKTRASDMPLWSFPEYFRPYNNKDHPARKNIRN